MPYPIRANKAVLLGTTYSAFTGGVSGYVYHVPYTINGVNLSTGNRKKNGKYVSGGNWYMRKSEEFREGVSCTVYRPGYGIAYTGSTSPGTHYSTPNIALPSNWNTDAYRDTMAGRLVSRGAEAWNRLRPAKPSFDLGLNLLELKDVPQTLKQATEVVLQRIRRSPKAPRHNSVSKYSGEWYLAIQFGWLPVLSSIKDFIRTQRKEQKAFNQIVRDAGRPVRRRGNLKDPDNNDSSTSVSFEDSFGAISPTLATQCYLNSGRTKGTMTQTQNSYTWSEGRFRYHLPPGPRTVAWKKKILRRIYGLRATPSLVYNLMPWSWLADYFSQLGSFMQSVSSGVEDRLAADYFYLMQTKEWCTTTVRSRHAASTVKGPPFVETSTTLTTKHTIKMRMRGSPFGFGVNPNNLTLNQVAILGALGLSKLPSYTF